MFFDLFKFKSKRCTCLFIIFFRFVFVDRHVSTYSFISSLFPYRFFSMFDLQFSLELSIYTLGNWQSLFGFDSLPHHHRPSSSSFRSFAFPSWRRRKKLFGSPSRFDFVSSEFFFYTHCQPCNCFLLSHIAGDASLSPLFSLFSFPFEHYRDPVTQNTVWEKEEDTCTFETRIFSFLLLFCRHFALFISFLIFASASMRHFRSLPAPSPVASFTICLYCTLLFDSPFHLFSFLLTDFELFRPTFSDSPTKHEPRFALSIVFPSFLTLLS